MHNERTNFLPLPRERALRRAYRLRVLTTGALLIAGLLCIASLLLLPMYTNLSGRITEKQKELRDVDSIINSSDEDRVSARLEKLGADTEVLLALSEGPSVSTVMREILAIPHSGVLLSGFAYTPDSAHSGKILVSGNAKTREALRTYQTALEEASFSSAVDMPVSAYAKDLDIDFAATITLAL